MLLPYQQRSYLHTEQAIHDCTQSGMSIIAYYTKLKGLWDERDALHAIPTCECGTMKEVMQHELGISTLFLVYLYCDNLSTNYMAANSVFHARTRNIELDYHFVCECWLGKSSGSFSTISWSTGRVTDQRTAQGEPPATAFQTGSSSDARFAGEC